MKVVIITQGISSVFESVLESKCEVVGIVECAPREEPPIFAKAGGRSLAAARYLFDSKPSNLKLFAKKLHVPYYYLKKEDSVNLEKWMKNLEPDLLVVYSMSHLLEENILRIPTQGAINLHYSYLPEYRGPNPVFWEYYDHVLNPGVTVHYIDEAEDAGDIIYQDRILINSGDAFKPSNGRITSLGITLLLKAMDAIEKGNAPRKKQAEESPTCRARNIKPEEYGSLIKWTEWDARRLFHFLNGTPKYHYRLLENNGLYKRSSRITLQGLEICDTSEYKVGSLCKEGSKYFFACKNGKIYVDFQFKPLKFLSCIYSAISRACFL